MDVDTTSQRLQTSNIPNIVYTTSVILKGELSSAEMQAAVCNNYGKIQSTLNNFQMILEKLFAKPKQQATLRNMFSRASSSK